ncbi:MAG TPA: ABC transporter substrate-binding protein [Syntrophales bacterium]|nr:ABC transporter substrate-binding protein [Syntrophales bacterium]
MKKRTVLSALVAGMLIGLIVASGSWAADVRGVTDKSVKIACLVDLSGPGKYGGPPVADAFRDYVAWVNDTGGINGRKIELVVEDNGILPNTTMAAARKVLLKDGVFAIAFNLGSAGASAIVPICQENKAVLMPHGANKKFYHPGNKWVFVPHTAQYDMATRAVEYVLEKTPKARIGIIYQDDDFGREGLEGARAAASFKKTALVKEAPYKTGTIDFTPHMNAMREAKVDTIVLWTYLPQSAAIIKQKARMGWNVSLISNNTTGVPPLFALAGEQADGYMLVTPYAPGWMDLPGIRRIKKINAKYGDPKKTLGNPAYPDYLYLAAWGYIESFGEGLRKAGRDLTPDSFVRGLESIQNHDMGGLCPNITFGPKRHVSSFSSLILKADGKKKRFVIVDPIREPKTPR